MHYESETGDRTCYAYNQDLDHVLRITLILHIVTDNSKS